MGRQRLCGTDADSRRTYVGYHRQHIALLCLADLRINAGTNGRAAAVHDECTPHPHWRTAAGWHEGTGSVAQKGMIGFVLYPDLARCEHAGRSCREGIRDIFVCSPPLQMMDMVPVDLRRFLLLFPGPPERRRGPAGLFPPSARPRPVAVHSPAA